MRELTGTIVDNTKIRENYYLLKIEVSYIPEKAVPGNFVMLGISGINDPLLKRPFGIFDIDSSHIYLYYEAIGRGTSLLSKKKGGDIVNLIGPLGNGFPHLTNKNILMVAGGRGIAPLYFALKGMGDTNSVSLVYGAFSADQLNFVEEIKNNAVNKLFFYTDDGSAFRKGFVTTEIINIIDETNPDAIFSCGPHSMLKALNELVQNSGIPNYASLEADMGCGFGVCHSCVVKNSSGHYIKVCTEGPVFESGEIDWEDLK